ncbi:MAG: flagellar biosynthetic protein FliR [Devosia sp.]
MNVAVNWLPETAFLFFLIFARVGAILMLMPALGEMLIPARMRLSFAIVFTLVLFPIISPQLPRLPTDVTGVTVLLVHELVIGLILGTIMRIITMAAAVAGSVIAFQAGLSIAQTADPTQGGVQGAVIGNFLGMVGVVLIFATNLHHVALYAIRDSYQIFAPTDPLMFGDAADMALRSAAGAFIVGVQMSAPFIVLGLVFYLGMGILGRMMPQLQVFFVAMPVTIAAGMVLLALLLTMMMGWYLTHYEAELAVFRGS